jgi:hypothetical protein
MTPVQSDRHLCGQTHRLDLGEIVARKLDNKKAELISDRTG